MLSALASMVPLFLGFLRAARMYLRTRDYLLGWRRRGKSAGLAQSPFEVVAVPGRDVALCVGGYLRPTIYASADLMRSLDPAEFDAALAHEVSHATSRDPLRLLWMRSCPDFLQAFSLDGPWRAAFARACEFTADARAVRGNPEVALDLASALVKVARLRAAPVVVSEHGLEVAVSSAYSSPVDLRARVEALTGPGLAEPTPARWLLPVSLVCGFSLTVLGAATSERVHGVAESVGRFLAP
jgi:Zn-dependent protease with chaperone function